MRDTIFAFINIMLIVMFVSILGMVISKSSRHEEIQSGLDNALELTIDLIANNGEKYNLYMRNVADGNLTAVTDEKLRQWGIYEISEEYPEEDLKSAFLEILSEQLNSSIGSLTVNFYGVDVDKGLLSVEVFVHFKYSNGSDGVVSAYRTILINKILK